MLKRGPPPPKPPLSSLGASVAGSVGGVPSSRSPSPLFQWAFFRERPILPLAPVDPEDLDLDLISHLDDFLGAVDLVIGQLRDVQQPFEAGLELDENAEIGQLRDLAVDHVVRLVTAGDVGLPRVIPEAV